MKLIYGFIGKNKDFKLIPVEEAKKEKAPRDCSPKRAIKKNIQLNYIK